ncbi:MAG: hypothetical protein K2W96_07255 [Gemmataceae bacterium]|nr:hypothetical protein [Gemmataceae bacterium]
MKTETNNHREVDLGLHNQNRAHFPPERLVPYAGQQIAFNWDGTEIIASAPSDIELVALLHARGIPRACYVVSYVDEY